jgi:hypothetical protein
MVSIVIVNYNGLKWLKDCFDSIEQQNYKDIQIIMVDNDSKDESVDFVLKNYPQVEIVYSKSNLGFAGGNNLAIEHIKGEYVILLNNDTKVEKNTIGNLVKALDNNKKIGSVQAKLVLMNEPEKLDICGAFWTGSTFLYYYGCFKNKNLEIYNKPMKVFSNKGAAQMIRKSIIDKIGLFDDDFWSYYEETDFCHRVWISGSECWYEPSAVVYHANGGTSLNFKNEFVQFHNYKNKLMSFIKNFDKIELIMIIPKYIFMTIMISFIYFLQGKFKMGLAIYKSYIWNIVNLKSNLGKRKTIQNFRERDDKSILKDIQRNPRWKYYLYLFTGLEKYVD